MKRATESTETTAGTAPVVRFDAVATDDHLIDVLAVSALNDDPLVDDGVGGGLVRLLMEMRRQGHVMADADDGSDTRTPVGGYWTEGDTPAGSG
jgi:hypothetical protein